MYLYIVCVIGSSIIWIFIGNAIVGVIMFTVYIRIAERASIGIILISLVTMILGFYIIKNKKQIKKI